MKLEKRDILSALILLIVVAMFFIVATTQPETGSPQETVSEEIIYYRGEIQIFNYAVPGGRVACSVVSEGISCVFVRAIPRSNSSFS